MEQTKKKSSRLIYFLLTLISIAGFFLLVKYNAGWVWTSLPFVATFAAKTADAI